MKDTYLPCRFNRISRLSSLLFHRLISWCQDIFHRADINSVSFHCFAETGYNCGGALIYLLDIVVLPLSYNTDGDPSIIDTVDLLQQISRPTSLHAASNHNVDQRCPSSQNCSGISGPQRVDPGHPTLASQPSLKRLALRLCRSVMTLVNRQVNGLVN